MFLVLLRSYSVEPQEALREGRIHGAHTAARVREDDDAKVCWPLLVVFNSRQFVWWEKFHDALSGVAAGGGLPMGTGNCCRFAIVSQPALAAGGLSSPD
jgi:hypothetical protein